MLFLNKQIFVILFFLFLSKEVFPLTILIDPGHGGEEDGAVVFSEGEAKKRIIKEKDIALSIAKKIYDLLKEKNHNAFLTRSLDRTVSLSERASIAEKIKADLFISVHINSSPEKGAVGFETYYLDNHDDVAVKKIEKTENISNTKDEVIVQQILIDLAVQETVKTSKPLANSIHLELKNSIGKKYKIPSRGIKPGLFFVLALSKRPGVLLEVGFISTLKERVRMMNPKFQEEYAKAVVKGIEIYFKKAKK